MFNFNEKLTFSICSKKWSWGATFNYIIALFGDAAKNSQFKQSSYVRRLHSVNVCSKSLKYKVNSHFASMKFKCISNQIAKKSYSQQHELRTTQCDGHWLDVSYFRLLVAQLVKNLPLMRETWVGKIPWRRERLRTPVFQPGESSMGSQRVGPDWATFNFFHFHQESRVQGRITRCSYIHGSYSGLGETTHKP